jgi:hypothetical protein
VPADIIANYTTPFVRFLDIESDLNWKPPPECQKEKGGAAVMKRFLIFHYMFQQGYFDDYKYVLVHVDLRDSRAFHWPQWGNHIVSFGCSPSIDQNIKAVVAFNRENGWRWPD